jgi:hypothetical protein
LIFGNKVDIAGAAFFADVAEALDLANLDDGNEKLIHLVMSSSRQNFGLMGGFKWMSTAVSSR